MLKNKTTTLLTIFLGKMESIRKRGRKENRKLEGRNHKTEKKKKGKRE